MKRVHRSGRKYKRGKAWIQQRDAAFERAGDTCEVSREPLGFYEPVLPTDPPEEPDPKRWHWRRAVHHVIAERFCRKFFKGVSPHLSENLVVVTSALHSKLTAAENKLFKADWLGYRSELNRLGMDLAILDRAFSALCAAEKNK